ncbi:MAG: hypothetical protein ACI81R_001982, partial [Bradymonadia bacterium]
MTENQRYNVLLVGTDDAGGPDEASAKLVERFRLSERVAAKLVRRLPAKVKKSVDLLQAEKYAKALRGLGMTVAVAEVGTTSEYAIVTEAGAAESDDEDSQPLMQDVLNDITSSPGVSPDAEFSSEIEAFLRGNSGPEAGGGPLFSLPEQIGDNEAHRPAKVIEATMPMVEDPSLEDPLDGGGDRFADQFSGALDPTLHADATGAEAEHDENVAVDDLFGVRGSSLNELALAADADEPLGVQGTRAMSPVDGFEHRPVGRSAGPGVAQPRKTAVEAPPSDWIERDHSFGVEAMSTPIDAFVSADHEATLEETLAQLTGEQDAVVAPTTTEFDEVSERMESTLSLDESALPKTTRNPGVGPTTSSLRSYRNTDSFRPPPPRSRLPAVLGVLAFLGVVGTGAYF